MNGRPGIVTRTGQVTIQAELRRQCNIQEGDAIAVRVVGGRLVLERGEDIARRLEEMHADFEIHPAPSSVEFRVMAEEAWAENVVERTNR